MDVYTPERAEILRVLSNYGKAGRKGNQMKKIALFLMAVVLIGCGGGSGPANTPPPPPTITGHWNGTAVSQVVTGTSGVSGTLTQGTTSPDGTINFSGSFTLTNSCISNLLVVNGKISGQSFALLGNVSDGSTLSVMANINATDTVINGTYQESGGTVCVADHGIFSLTKQ